MDKRGILLIFVLAFAFVFIAGSVSAATVQCNTVPSCNSAIASAAANDIIQMNKSINYTANGTAIDFAGKDNITFDCNDFSLIGPGNSNSANYGIYFNYASSGSNNDTVENCNVSNFYYGIYVDSSGANSFYNTIKDSNVSHSKQDGIMIYSNAKDDKITNVISNYNGEYGINLYLLSSPTYSNILIANSTADYNTAQGLAMLYGTNNTISNSVFDYNQQGVSVNSINNTFTGLNVNFNTKVGFLISSGQYGNNLSNVNMSGNGEYDFRVQSAGSGTHLRNYIGLSNTVDFSHKIYYNYSASNYVFNQTTAPNAGFLYCVSCNNVTYEGFNFTNRPLLFGIVFYNTNNSKILNSVFSHLNITGGAGISFQDVCSNDTIENVVSSFNPNGIVISSNGAGSHNNTIKNVTVNSNTNSGLNLDSFNGSVQDSSFNSNPSGIYISNSNGTLFSNVTLNSNVQGIVLSAGAANTFTDSKIFNSSSYGIHMGFGSGNNTFYNNLFNNTVNYYNDTANLVNYFSVTLTSGINILGGSYIGGNAWDNYSAPGTLNFGKCADLDNDGICDSSYMLSDGISTDYYPLTSSPTSNWPIFQGNLYHTGYYPGSVNVSNMTKLWNYSKTVSEPSASILYGGLLYVTWSNGTVLAFNATKGNVLWSYTAGSVGINTSPAISKGIVYVGSKDNNLYALNATNGKQIWNYSTGNQIFFSSPSISSGIVYFGSTDGNAYALNATNGIQIWNNSIGVVKTSPAVANGIVYLGAGSSMYALNATNGTTIWSYTSPATTYSSPSLSDGILYFGDGIASASSFYALNATNGSKIWSYATGGAIISSPAVSPRKIVYFESEDNNLYALNATNGSKIWNYTMVNASSPMNSPVISKGKVYFSGGGYFYIFNSTNGTQIWNYTLSALSPIISKGVVYVGGCLIGDCGMYAFATPAQVSTPSTPSTPPSGTPVGNSGGGGTVGGNTTKSTRRTTTTSGTFTNITAGTPVTVYPNSNSIGLTSVTFTTNQTVYNATVNVSSVSRFSAANLKIATNSTGRRAGTYESFQITTSVVNDSIITGTVMNFTVNASWFASTGFSPSSVALYRNTGTTFSPNWTALPTTLVKSDSLYYYFSAKSPGFSNYTIVAFSSNACTLGAIRCLGNDVQTCTTLGTWRTSQTCQYGCQFSQCLKNPKSPIGAVSNVLTNVRAHLGNVFYYLLLSLTLVGIIFTIYILSRRSALSRTKGIFNAIKRMNKHEDTI